MLRIAQSIASLFISAIGSIVTILILTGVIIWLAKELITKKTDLLKLILLILFFSVIISFMPQLI